MNALFRSRTHRRSTTFGAGLEPLEGRALLSVSVTPLTDPAPPPWLQLKQPQIKTRRALPLRFPLSSMVNP